MSGGAAGTAGAAQRQRFVQVGAGASSSCALTTDKNVVCWGMDNSQVVIDGPYDAISVGYRTACGLNRSTRKVRCWNLWDYSFEGELPGSYQSIDVGMVQCGVTESGAVYCHDVHTGVYSGSPTKGEFMVAAIARGVWHGYALRTNGSVAYWAWGGGKETVVAAELPDFPGDFIDLVADERYACAIRRDDHSVECWGSMGPTLPPPETLPPPGAFSSLAAGTEHVCGLRPNGRAECWGKNDAGQSSPPPGPFVQISAGYEHTCAVTADLRLVCWGTDTGPVPE